MQAKKAQPVDLQVGSRIRIRRLMVNMSQTQLASRLGITFQQVQKYEKGANRVGASRLMAIADSLGVQPGFFFQNDDGQPLSDANAVQPGAEQHSVISLLTADGISLNKAFLKIRDPLQRRHIIGLVKAIAEREKADGPKLVKEHTLVHRGTAKDRPPLWR
ncbi:transcriptional regulator [Phyllobacterium phragmitis]|uniref:Transcriptional regulator n=1 Tax=Phyllobacterium phragmitis TaxID=2670329 RepID=A0A2S9IWE6_9HYPH|nr:helix-turn-helix transcriptional regulator [Phyllobacterium phragmitis]PRD44849.1 transcriptional regulator [Phyllobacterium phragmitis]